MEDLVTETTVLHAHFWNRALKRPIINTEYSLTKRLNRLFDYDKGALAEDWRGRDGLVLEPGMMVPERHHRFAQYDSVHPPVCGPVFNTVFPWSMVPWLTGLVGCEIKVSAVAQTIWPEATLGADWFSQESFGLKPNRQWLAKLLEFTSYLIAKHHPQCAVTLEMFSRGPGDLLLNVMGAERAYVEMYDHPQEVRGLLARIATLHIEWAKDQLTLIPPLAGGYCTHWGIWAPGTVTRIQEDFSINMSKKMFFDFLAPYEEKIVDAIDFHVFHTHSGSPQLAEWVAELDRLKAVEVTLDPFGPTLTELIPVWNRVLEKKPLIISATLTEPQLRLLESSLSPNGLLLDVDLTSGKQSGA
jgi:hypothetical protein